MTKIDLIIPTYKAKNTIFQALSSVAIQTIAKDVNVIMVVDCDGYNYDDLYHKFDGVFGDFTMYYLEENGGPAVARQFGIDKGTSPYIMFLDADDTFSGAFTFELLVNKMEKNQNVVLVSSVFYEKRHDLSFVQHSNDLTWVHGKLYSRAFLNKYDIRFNTTRANEDVGFNTKIKLLESETERILFADTLSYYWHWTDTGITRVNNFEYTYDQSYVGYVENQIDAINHALKYIESNNPFLLGHSVETLTNIYIYILRIRFHRPELEPRAWEYARLYYDKVIENIDMTEMLDETFREIVSVSIENQLPHLRGNIFDMTFHEFMKILVA